MDRIRLLTIVGVGTFFAAVLYFMTGKSPFPAIGVGAVLALLVLAATSLPKRSRADNDSVEQKPRRRKAVGPDPREIAGTAGSRSARHRKKTERRK